MAGESTVLDDSQHGFPQHVVGVYLSPVEEFTAILRKPSFWAPLAVSVLLNLAFTGIWMQKVDAKQFMIAQLEESGRMEKIPADRRDEIVEQQAKFFPVFGWVGGLLGLPIVVLVVATVYLFVFRMFFGGDVTFKQSMTVVAYSFLAVGLVQTPLLLATLALKGDWNINPQHALQANLSLLFDRQETAKPLYALAGSLDLFSFWLLALLSAGYGAALRRPAAAAAWGVVGAWALVVVCKVGWAALF